MIPKITDPQQQSAHSAPPIRPLCSLCALCFLPASAHRVSVLIPSARLVDVVAVVTVCLLSAAAAHRTDTDVPVSPLTQADPIRSALCDLGPAGAVSAH